MGRAHRNPLVLAVLVAGLSGPTQAHAATARVGEPELELGGPPVIFTAEAGEANRLTVSSIPGNGEAVVFDDDGAPITAGRGCRPAPDETIVCRADDLAGVRVVLDDRPDRLDASMLRDQNPPPSPQASNFFAVEIRGGHADDDLVGADATYSCLAGGPGDDTIASAVTPAAPERALCGPIGGDGDDRLIGSPTDDPFSGGPGIDSIAGRSGDDFAGAGAGDDRVALGSGSDFGSGRTGSDRVLGGGGGDSLADSRGADALSGQEGPDRFAVNFRTAGGTDELRGGPGSDIARFLCPSCRVSLDDIANDGPTGAARDNAVQIERAITTSTRYDPVAEAPASVGPGDDRLTGNGLANLLDGRAGPDRITGGGGPDRLLGRRGDDLLRAADGAADTVHCGRGDDRAVADPGDSLSGCERVSR